MTRRLAGLVLGTMLMQAAAVRGALADEDPLAAAIARNPARFETEAIDVIAGFGGPEGLTAKGIETHIALKRAAARASAVRRFLAMDLDADGSVSREELLATQMASSAQGRGRMERQFTAADADDNGLIDAGEIAASAKAAALAALDEDEANLLRALLSLDADADGAVTSGEVSAAVARQDTAG